MALGVSVLLLAVFSLATAGVLVLAGPRGNEWGSCSETNTGGGMIADQPLEIRQRYEHWEYVHGGVHGLLPHRSCSLYAARATAGPYVLVAEKEYPGDGWYVAGLLIVAAPLVLLGAWRVVKTKRQ